MLFLIMNTIIIIQYEKKTFPNCALLRRSHIEWPSYLSVLEFYTSLDQNGSPRVQVSM